MAVLRGSNTVVACSCYRGHSYSRFRVDCCQSNKELSSMLQAGGFVSLQQVTKVYSPGLICKVYQNLRLISLAHVNCRSFTASLTFWSCHCRVWVGFFESIWGCGIPSSVDSFGDTQFLESPKRIDFQLVLTATETSTPSQAEIAREEASAGWMVNQDVTWQVPAVWPTMPWAS